MSTKLINVLANLYSKATLQVNTPEGMSNTCPISEKLQQGELISPLMFALYISDIESFLEAERIGGVSLNHWMDIIVLAFANDSVFLLGSQIQMKKNAKILA